MRIPFFVGTREVGISRSCV